LRAAAIGGDENEETGKTTTALSTKLARGSATSTITARTIQTATVIATRRGRKSPIGGGDPRGLMR
jgi:hypothetical protein